MTNGYTAHEVEDIERTLELANDEIDRLKREITRLQDTRYNGWTNYATWRINLDICDDYLNNLTSQLDTYREQTFTDASTLADHLSNHVDDVISNYGEAECLAVDYARSFVSDVDWHEIAEHYPDLIETDDAEQDTTCPDCWGIGELAPLVTCPKCNGSGSIKGDD